jgi:hypothetical protein
MNRIALLDDEPSSRGLLVELFTALGYVIEGDVGRADVIVADISTSGAGSGLDYLAHRDARPVLITTGGSRHHALKLMRRYGVDLAQIVFRPYDASSLGRRVEAELRRGRSLR